MEYNFKAIEAKWRNYWEQNKTYKVSNDSDKPKYYVLDMFPYPSGAGLHVGHPLGYIASDIYARYKRAKGYNVLHPMGFDAFGLPAEQYAIETGQHPAITTAKNSERYKEQLNNIGFSFDWSRSVVTSDPGYYKWTQWIFLQLFNSWYNNDTAKAESIETLISKFEISGSSSIYAANNLDTSFTADEWKAMSEKEQNIVLLSFRLAYLAYSEVNWCPALGTVLANDEVKEGFSERGGHPVERKKMRQWFLRITAYAERLLNGLHDIDWPESLKDQQRNWIGRSEGAIIQFKMTNDPLSIEVFTTRPDTIFGSTFLVLAPEHDLVEKITTPQQKEKIETYLSYVKSRTDVERQQEKRVTGEFTGAYALNPLTGNQIPVWIAEYVLVNYGTGAIMAVPSDDDRDHAFATKFGMKIIEVIDKAGYPEATRGDKVGKMINSDFINGMDVKNAIVAVIDKVEETGIGKRKVHYRLRDAGFSRQRYWGEPFPIYYKNGMPYPLSENELPVILPEVESYKPTGDGEAPLAGNSAWVNLPNGTKRETDTMPGYAASSWYYLRYMNPENTIEFASEKAIDYWRDVDLYIGGSEHAVGHLMYARFWHKFLFDIGKVPTHEPFKKLINQGMIQGRSSLVYRGNVDQKFYSFNLIKNSIGRFSPSIEPPVSSKAVLESMTYLNSVQDFTKIRVDVNMVENDILDIEAFKRWRDEFAHAQFELEEDGKYHCGYEVEKMSKRWHNVVNPDDMVAKYGADCFRMYEMFLGPVEQHKPWDTKGIEGVSRFIRKLWRLFHNEQGQLQVTNDSASKEELKSLHKAIKKTIEDTERFSFNTVVSTFMICVNELTDLKCHKREILSPFVVLISPFAPHIAEELWCLLGNASSIAVEIYPEYKEDYLVESSVTYPVSFNGKVRFKLDLPVGLSKESVEKEVMSNDQLEKWLEGKTPKKIIVIPNKIVNIVI